MQKTYPGLATQSKATSYLPTLFSISCRPLTSSQPESPSAREPAALQCVMCLPEVPATEYGQDDGSAAGWHCETNLTASLVGWALACALSCLAQHRQLVWDVFRDDPCSATCARIHHAPVGILDALCVLCCPLSSCSSEHLWPLPCFPGAPCAAIEMDKPRYFFHLCALGMTRPSSMASLSLFCMCVRREREGERERGRAASSTRRTYLQTSHEVGPASPKCCFKMLCDSTSC